MPVYTCIDTIHLFFLKRSTHKQSFGALKTDLSENPGQGEDIKKLFVLMCSEEKQFLASDDRLYAVISMFDIRVCAPLSPLCT